MNLIFPSLTNLPNLVHGIQAERSSSLVRLLCRVLLPLAFPKPLCPWSALAGCWSAIWSRCTECDDEDSKAGNHFAVTCKILDNFLQMKKCSSLCSKPFVVILLIFIPAAIFLSLLIPREPHVQNVGPSNPEFYDFPSCIQMVNRSKPPNPQNWSDWYVHPTLFLYRFLYPDFLGQLKQRPLHYGRKNILAQFPRILTLFQRFIKLMFGVRQLSATFWFLFII